MRTPLWTAMGLLLLTSCGAPPPQITPQVRERLLADIEQVRSAALQHDRIGSDAALLTLTRDIAAAQASGELDPAYARNLLAASDRISADAAEFPPPAPPRAVTIIAPAPAQQVAAPPAPGTVPPGGAPSADQQPGNANSAGTPAPQATMTPAPAANQGGGNGKGKGEPAKGQGQEEGQGQG